MTRHDQSRATRPNVLGLSVAYPLREMKEAAASGPDGAPVFLHAKPITLCNPAEQMADSTSLARARWLREHLATRGMDIIDLARITRWAVGQISLFLHGEVRLTPAAFRELAAALSVEPPGDLLDP